MLWDSKFIPRHWQQRGAVTTTGCSNPRRPAVPPFHRPHLHSALHCLEPLLLHRVPPAPSLSTCHVASVQSLLAFPPHRTSSVVSTLRKDSCHQRCVPPRRGTARTEKQGEIFHLGSFPLFIPPSAQPNPDRSVRHLAPAWAACQDHSESRLADERERPARPRCTMGRTSSRAERSSSMFVYPRRGSPSSPTGRGPGATREAGRTTPA